MLNSVSRLHFRSAAGFTLIELMLVVTIIGIIASVAVPGLLRARGSAAEVSAMGSLKAIHSAQMSFATSCGGGYYAPSIAQLTGGQISQGNQGQGKGGGKKVDAGPDFIGPEFKSDTTDRLPYRILFSAGAKAADGKATCNGVAAGETVGSFFVGADLLSATNGMVSRYFGINQTGTLYESSKRIAAFYTGAPPSPARPVR
jgi:prepilin-type N-terminal cleavage/methylation domain-containing protein